jgi:hypothetical protein
MSLLNLIPPNSIIPSHKGTAMVREITMWLVDVKMYGNSPIKLLIIINIKRDINTNLKYLFLNTMILNSLKSPSVNSLTNCFEALFFTQNTLTISARIIPETQFKDRVLLVEGSNDENRLVIMIIDSYLGRALRYFSFLRSLLFSGV